MMPYLSGHVMVEPRVDTWRPAVCPSHDRHVRLPYMRAAPLYAPIPTVLVTPLSELPHHFYV